VGCPRGQSSEIGICVGWPYTEALKHAQCWAHCRREFFNARAPEPVLANEALDRIGAIYKVEEDIRARKLSGEQDFSGHHLLCIRSRDIGIDARAIFGTSIHARCHMVSILIPSADDWDRKNP
jgi:hypothetical protein